MTDNWTPNQRNTFQLRHTGKMNAMPERLVQFKCSCGEMFPNRDALHNHLRTYADHEGASDAANATPPEKNEPPK
jgi:hypothetical protein